MKMDCNEIQPNLMDYSLGRLTPPETEQVRGHLATCEECCALLEEEKALSSGLAEMTPVAPENDVWALIRSRTRPRSPVFGLMRARAAKLVAAGVAVAAVALALVNVHVPSQPTQADRDSIRAVAAVMTTHPDASIEYTRSAAPDGVTSADDPLGSDSDALAATIDEGT